MKSYYYCLFLVILVSFTVPTSSQHENCNAFEAGTKNFYKITQLRQFPGQEPLWVKIKGEEFYYNLNGVIFKVGDHPKEDIAVNGFNWAGKTWEVEDVSQNRLTRNRTNAYVFLKKQNRSYEIKFDDPDTYDFYEDYSAVLEPHADVAFMLKKTNSQTQHGKLFWLAFKQPVIEGGAIVANRVPFFDGTAISIDIDGPANKIILAAKKNNIGVLYLLRHSKYNPCRINPENVVLKFVQSSYNAFKTAVLRNGLFKCETYRQEVTELESERSAACKKLSDYETNMNEEGKKGIIALIEEAKSLRELINEQRALVQDANTKLQRLLTTAILNKHTNTPGGNSVFSEKLMTSEIDEYAAHNYVCVLKDELDKGEKELDIGTQLSYLKDALFMVKEDLEVISTQT